MCGIVGKLDFKGPVDQALVHRMCSALVHRGPDSEGMFVQDGVGLGMRRLAIIDVAGGAQPIFNEDRSVAVVMNGEIYNYRSLREDLFRRGHRLTTHSDTEVLVHLYEELGDRFVDRLRGMFAFAIWDARQRRLLLGRDRVGKKPLFWTRQGSKVWFASELVALLQDPEIARAPDPRAIAAYLTFQYVPHSLCAFEGIGKVAPATTVSIREESVEPRPYWRLRYRDRYKGVSQEELAEQLRELIWDATRIRLHSEVPLGAFLSGGVDSSAVVAAMADQLSSPVKTFSIGFGEADFDELRYARMAAEQFSTDHHEFRVEPDAIAIMPKLARHYGEPFADPSALPSFYLAELTGRHVTVALNGDGGDESFAGYGRYVANDIVARLARLPAPVRRLAPALVRPVGEGSRDDSFQARLQRAARSLAMEPHARYAQWMSAFRPESHQSLFQAEFLESLEGWSPADVLGAHWYKAETSSEIDTMLHVDVQTYLPDDLLVKMDIATMAHSVEARSPLLDQELMQFAASLPARHKLRGQAGKRLLKVALRGIVPDAILDRPKMGFGVPLAHWFRDELRTLPGEILLDPAARCVQYVRREAIEDMLRNHLQGRADNSLSIWTLLQLEYWHSEIVELQDPGRRDQSASPLQAHAAV